MTDAVALKPDLGRFGVWTFGTPKPEQAVEIEKLGYGALWIGGSPAGDLNYVEPILEHTETLQVATGIVNVWTAPADQVAEAYHRIEDAYPGRFLLGIGIGHPEHTDEYRKPYDVLVEYLDVLDATKVPTSRRVVAALGPKVLKLAAQRSAGAHPYLTTPEHTGSGARIDRSQRVSGARAQGGADHRRRRGARDRPTDRRLLSEPEQLPQQLEATRLHRQGLAKPGSDRLIDAVVAHGTPDDIAKRLNEHLRGRGGPRHHPGARRLGQAAADARRSWPGRWG